MTFAVLNPHSLHKRGNEACGLGALPTESTNANPLDGRRDRESGNSICIGGTTEPPAAFSSFADGCSRHGYFRRLFERNWRHCTTAEGFESAVQVRSSDAAIGNQHIGSFCASTMKARIRRRTVSFRIQERGRGVRQYNA